MANEDELTEEKKREILDYCEDHLDDGWDQIGARFGLPAETVSKLYIASL